MIKETVIKVVPEGTFPLTPNLHYDLVELNYILVDILTIFHGQVVKLMLHISNRVMWTKIHLKLQNKLLIILHPKKTELRIIYEEKVWFKLFQGNPFEVRLYKNDFSMVLSKCSRAFVEVEFVLYQKDPEFSEISPIKLVWFSDFGTLQGFRKVVM